MIWRKETRIWAPRASWGLYEGRGKWSLIFLLEISNLVQWDSEGKRDKLQSSSSGRKNSGFWLKHMHRNLRAVKVEVQIQLQWGIPDNLLQKVTVTKRVWGWETEEDILWVIVFRWNLAPGADVSKIRISKVLPAKFFSCPWISYRIHCQQSQLVIGAPILGSNVLGLQVPTGIEKQ